MASETADSRRTKIPVKGVTSVTGGYNTPMFMKNKRHLPGATVRVTPKLHPEVGHHGPPVLLGFKGGGRQVRVTGILSYRNGGLAEFDACLTEDEEKALARLVTSVANRVHAMLLNNDKNGGRRHH